MLLNIYLLMVQFTLLTILVLSISIFSFYFSIYRIKTSEKTSLSHRPLHSYYGWYSLFWTLFPALLSFCVWTFCANIWIDKSIIDLFTINISDGSKASANLQLNAIKNAANGIMVGKVPEELVNTYIALQQKSNIARFAITLGASLIGFFVGFALGPNPVFFSSIPCIFNGLSFGHSPGSGLFLMF